MIVADTSAWVDYLRGRDQPAALRLRSLLEQRGEVAITESILMEVLAGARSGAALGAIRSQLIDLPILRIEGIEDFEQAAAIYRACREGGYTLRSQLDLLVAVPTIRHGASLLHNDRDFEVIARHSALKLEPLLPPPGGDGQRGIRERATRYQRPRKRIRSSAPSRQKRIRSRGALPAAGRTS